MRGSLFGQVAGMAILPSKLLGILPVGCLLPMHGTLSAETFLAVIVLSFGVMQPLITAFSYTDDIAQVKTIVGEVAEVLSDEDMQRPTTAEKLPVDNSIELKDVRFAYHDKEVLHGINLNIAPGTVNALVGPSGSGKSTIIKLLTGELVPSRGRVMINGFSMSNITRRQIPLMRRTVGVIFQDFRLIGNKTVYDNLSLAMRAVGASAREIKSRIPYVLGLVGLDGKGRRFPDELSGGEQQRVAIARALAKNPRLLLCDEPTGALDYVTGKAVLKLLYDLSKERGMTVIIITHNQAIAPMADRIIRIKSGKIRSNEINENVVPIDEIEW